MTLVDRSVHLDSHAAPGSTVPLDAIGRPSSWRGAYRRRLLITDTVVVAGAVAIAQVARFGVDAQAPSTVFVTAYSVVLGGVWLTMLALTESRDAGFIGQGADEYRRVFLATGWTLATIALVGLVLQAGLARSYLAIAIPIGLVGLIASRHRLRRRLARQRVAGRFRSDVIIVGSMNSIAPITAKIDAVPHLGLRVIGACILGHEADSEDTVYVGSRSIPIFGNEHSIDAALTLTSAMTVAVASVEQIGHENMRTLAWRVEEHGADLLVAPGVLDVAGPRLKVRLIDNLAMLQLDRGRRDGAAMIGKRVFDLCVATVMLVMTLPVLTFAAIAIKLSDGGPVFFRQQRLGLHGRGFWIWKLRTMVVDAESRIDEARSSNGQEESVFFKSANDARITRVGRYLRKTSIDELPQLLNVLRGDMSLVGPRPLVPGEGVRVADFVERRSLVKPGITGLWQVSGRSELPEAERIRLDHYYVDNWSMVQDILILGRTATAVFSSDGAY